MEADTVFCKEHSGSLLHESYYGGGKGFSIIFIIVALIGFKGGEVWVANCPDSLVLFCRGVSVTCHMTHAVFLRSFLPLFYFEDS